MDKNTQLNFHLTDYGIWLHLGLFLQVIRSMLTLSCMEGSFFPLIYSEIWLLFRRSRLCINCLFHFWLKNFNNINKINYSTPLHKTRQLLLYNCIPTRSKQVNNLFTVVLHSQVTSIANMTLNYIVYYTIYYQLKVDVKSKECT